MSLRIDHIESNDFLTRSACSGVIDRIAAIYTAKSLSQLARETTTHASRPRHRECLLLMDKASCRQQIHAYRSHPRLPSSWLITLIIVERDSCVRLEARLALAAEHPDHDAYERGDKDNKVDCPSHVTHLAIVPLRASELRPSIGSLSDGGCWRPELDR
jgi:hypothetical protein